MNLPKENSKWASGKPEHTSGWSHASGIPTKSSGWFPASGSTIRENIIKGHTRPTKNASGLTPKENILNRHFRNASGSGVGAITWNVADGAYEDANGIKYTLNDDGVTFDDGSGNNFNADGSLAGQSSFLSSLGSLFTSPSTVSAAADLAKASINANTTLSAQQKQAQIAASSAGVQKANSWVLPVTLVGGLVAAGLAYHYFIAKKK